MSQTPSGFGYEKRKWLAGLQMWFRISHEGLSEVGFRGRG